MVKWRQRGTSRLKAELKNGRNLLFRAGEDAQKKYGHLIISHHDVVKEFENAWDITWGNIHNLGNYEMHDEYEFDDLDDKVLDKYRVSH